MKRSSLARKLLVPSVLVATVSVVSVGFLSLASAENLFTERSQASLQQETRTAATHIASWLDDRRQDVTAWGGLSEVNPALAGGIDSASALNGELVGLVGHYPFCMAISLLDAKGKTVASSDPARLGKDFSSRQYFQDAMKGHAVLSDVLVSKVTGQPFFTVAVPTGEAHPLGVVYAPIGVSAFESLFLSPFAADGHSYAFLFQRGTDTILAHHDSSLVLKTVLDSLPCGGAFRSIGSDSIGMGTWGGRSWRVSMAGIPGTPWVVGVVRDAEPERARLVQTRWLILGAAIIASLLIGLLIYLVLRPVLACLREAIDFAGKLSVGDVSHRLSSRSGDEIGDLCESLDTMVVTLQEQSAVAKRVAERDMMVEVHPRSDADSLGHALAAMVGNLREMLSKTRHTSQDVTNSIASLRSSSADMAEASSNASRELISVSSASEEVHRNVQTVAAAAEEMGASIRDIARSSGEAAAFASVAVAQAREADAIVGRLGAASAEIGGVIDTISGIANQTNLLALNATIEAARAGEAGRGFAVVAGEVKELSKATGTATEEIRKRIKGIQTDMVAAVAVIRGSAQQIQGISDLATSIAGAIEEQTSATAEISRSLSEASIGVGEISSGVAVVSMAATTVARSADAVRTRSDALSVSAVELDGLVGSFQVD